MLELLDVKLDMVPPRFPVQAVCQCGNGTLFSGGARNMSNPVRTPVPVFAQNQSGV
jgi:hypothetical protein